MALVSYYLSCLDTSFYYPILSPLKSVVSGKTTEDLQRIRFLSLTVGEFNGFDGFAGYVDRWMRNGVYKALGVLWRTLEA
ncbi:hypothetical protein RHSIM_RhsimUnG0045100 [Rhododendron simsii]|uniref:Uncharacterized protein n=1 Tax=Rhododendron simsii TaxID=118357 RepID=A0A834L4Y3_RHOSS|nr:hypothetical protein RHSIM_RhsimUnG0045100 [Rhododendron simsii]